MRELARKRRQEATVIEQSKPYDSNSNGRAENTVKRPESQVRTLKLATLKLATEMMIKKKQKKNTIRTLRI